MRTGWIVLGVVLLTLGSLSLVFDGIAYTTRDEVVAVGPLEVRAEREERLALPPWLAFAFLGAGTVGVIAGVQGRRGRR